MSEGPLFPKKTDPEGQAESPPVVIERSDDPDSAKTTSGTGRGVPRVPGRPVGCGSSVFVLLLVVGLVVVGGAVL